MRKPVVALIKLYQRTLSPDHGWTKHRHPAGFCRFYPTCSQYAVEAVQSRGVLRGCLLALARIIRCNPWSRGGIDQLPQSSKAGVARG